MADQKISQLPAADALDGSERIPLEQGGTTKHIPSDTYQQAHAVVIDVTHADYGAVAGQVSTAAIQSAIDDANAAGGGIVFIPAGTFIVDSTLTWRSNVAIWGAGEGVTILQHVGGVTSFNVLSIPDAEKNGHVGLDFSIDLNKANTTAAASDTEGLGIYFAGNTGDALRNTLGRVEVYNGHKAGVRQLGHGTDYTDIGEYHIDMWEVWVHDCDQTGMRFTKGRHIHLLDCRAEDNGGEGVLFAGPTDETSVTGGAFLRNGNSGVTWTYARAAKCVGATCDENTEWGITFGGGDDTMPINDSYTITANTCRNNGAGGITNDPTLDSTPDAVQDVHATVTANVCRDNSSHGIYVQKAGKVGVHGNTCENNGTSGTGSGIAVNSIGCGVSGNTLTGNGQYGLIFQGVVTGAGDHTVGVNHYAGNGSGDFEVASGVTFTGPLEAFTMASPGWYAPSPKALTTHSHGEGVLTVTTLLVPKTTEFARIACEVTTAGETDSVIRLGVYADDGGPSPLLFDAGTILADTTGVKEVTITQSISGLVWVAAVAQNCPNTAPTLRAITNNATRPNYLPANAFNSTQPGIVETGVTGALPDPWSGFNLTNTNNVYLVELRVA